MSTGSSAFNAAELEYLRSEQRLAHIATVGKDGTPHVVPVGMWSHNPDLDAIEVTGHDFAQTKKFRDVARSGRAAIVIDDMVELDPAEREAAGGWDWRPRGIEIRGDAEAVSQPQAMLRIRPRRIVSWGIEGAMQRNARTVAPSEQGGRDDA